MAQNHSFDIVSEIDLQEADNAINQAIKEITERILAKEDGPLPTRKRASAGRANRRG